MTDLYNTGGSAFPHPEPRDLRFSIVAPGMTLRDYFAAHAPSQPESWQAPHDMLMQAVRPAGRGPEHAAEWSAYNVAILQNIFTHEVTWRWAYAAAMIKARGNPT